MNGYLQSILLRISLMLIGGICATAAQTTVSARFEPALVHAGQATHFILQVDGTQGSISYSPPAIAGLRVVGGQRRGNSISVINGATSIQQTVAIPMLADAEGTYASPAFEVIVGGKAYSVAAAQLKVLAADEATNQSAEQAQVKLALSVPPGPYYVGQAIPVTLTLSADPQVNILDNSLPKKTGSENYTISAFADSTMRRAQAGRRIVNEHTFSAVAIPLSGGDMAIGFEQTLLVRMPSQRDTADRSSDPFARMFDMDSVFGGIGNRQQVTLRTDTLSLKIDSLPAAGRPQDFTGAIGKFRVAGQQLSAQEVQVGEPVTLAIAIDGEGNFDRIQPPALADSALWRSYTPQSRFQPQNALGMSGRKIFEYTLIPRTPEATTTPQIDFNYFDPETGRYVTIPVAGLPLRVTAAADTAAANASTPGGTALAPTNASRQSDDGLLPLITIAPTHSGSATLLLRQPLFYAAQAVPALALVLLIIYRKRILRLKRDPYFARKTAAKKQVRDALAAARRSAQAGNAIAFYEAAEQALKVLLSREEPHIAAASLTWNDLRSRLESRHATAEQTARTRSFFDVADALRYASENAPQATAQVLPSRLAELEALLKELDSAATKQTPDNTAAPAASGFRKR